tara:strand:- start:647 stop:1144 length:498 start_codon:yes stop_codon:yes gene_type:complete
MKEAVKGSVHTKAMDTPELAAAIMGASVLASHFAGWQVVGGEALTAAMTAVIYQAVHVVIRLCRKWWGTRSPSSDMTAVLLVGTLPIITVMLMVALVATLSVVSGCGSTYTLKRGGWTLDNTTEGVCLYVHGDDDPEVARICIADPEPLMIHEEILKGVCHGVER